MLLLLENAFPSSSQCAILAFCANDIVLHIRKHSRALPPLHVPTKLRKRIFRTFYGKFVARRSDAKYWHFWLCASRTFQCANAQFLSLRILKSREVKRDGAARLGIPHVTYPAVHLTFSISAAKWQIEMRIIKGYLRDVPSIIPLRGDSATLSYLPPSASRARKHAVVKYLNFYHCKYYLHH